MEKAFASHGDFVFTEVRRVCGPPVPSRLQSSGVSLDDLETSFTPGLAPMPAHTCADRGHVSYVFHSLLSASLWELHEQRAKVCGNAHYRVDTRWGLVPTFLPCLKWSILSVQFSHSVVSDSLWPHGPQHARSPCPSPTPGVYSNSCPLSRWWHPTMSSSVVPKSVPTHALKNVNGVLPGTARAQREHFPWGFCPATVNVLFPSVLRLVHLLCLIPAFPQLI